jgi:membrane-associated protease RseP (regulator of RpoE activity)
MFTQLISDARAAEWEFITPEDEPRLFYRMPWWKKVIVMAGGPSVNILIAFFVFWGVFSFYGNLAAPSRAVLGSVSTCVIPASEHRTECKPGDPPSPAFSAGLRAGDEITSFNGVHVTDQDQLHSLIRANRDGRAVIGFVRDGKAMTTTTNTTVSMQPESATDSKLVQVGFLGVTFDSYALAKGGPVYTVKQMGETAHETAVALVHLPQRVFGVGKAIVGLQPRDPNSPVSIVGGGRIAGEAASSHALTTADKIAFLMMLIAGFNFFIGAFNFLPLLPLDGGHIASALWEAIRRGWARLRRLPDPGFVDAARLLPIAYVAASAMLAMSLVLIVGDVVVPVSTGLPH